MKLALSHRLGPVHRFALNDVLDRGQWASGPILALFLQVWDATAGVFRAPAGNERGRALLFCGVCVCHVDLTREFFLFVSKVLLFGHRCGQSLLR